MFANQQPMLSCDTVPTALTTARPAAVSVHAPARLHLGFMDPAGTLGQPFGSLGLVIDGFETVVQLSSADSDALWGSTPAAQAEVARAQAHLALLRLHSGCHAPLQLQLLQVMPAHAGFGSGTQLALAVGRAFARLHGLAVGSAALAGWLGRGQRSGIGIGGFDQGGLLLDGGPTAGGQAAPILSRLTLAPAWRVLVVQDRRALGLHGPQEAQAIRQLAPMPAAQAAEICHQVLMRVLPGAANADFSAFATGLNRVQQLLGAHFAPAQQGRAFTSPAVGQLLQWLAQAPLGPGWPGAAVGQSSWGPTGFAVLPSAAAAEAAVQAVRSAGLVVPGLTLQTVSARNRGATLRIR